MQDLAGLFFIIVLLVLYFLPGIIASARTHHNALAIWVLTLFLGWTALGWIVALVWAFTAVQPKLKSE
jgi:RsiW-degrading membrane proteinase PrsW (M82 family)